MKTFGFGQPLGGIMQTSFVVKDIREAIDFWIRDANVGPWFLLESFKGDDQIYRSEKSTADVAIAMSFAGHMNIELIQPKDDNPSVYKETVDRLGYGFHHIGIAAEDVDAGIADYEARGYELAFRAGVPTGGAVAYMDGGSDKPGFVELIPATPLMDEAFTNFWKASVDWNGADPIRPFA